MKKLLFEWDSQKDKRNLKKHGISFQEASTVFGDPLARIIDDEGHSETEYREIIIGESIKKRLLVVVFTERNDRIRMISARPATQHERIYYEEYR